MGYRSGGITPKSYTVKMDPVTNQNLKKCGIIWADFIVRMGLLYLTKVVASFGIDTVSLTGGSAPPLRMCFRDIKNGIGLI